DVRRFRQQGVEGVAAAGLLQPVDATEAAVVEQYDRQFESEHDGSGDLGIHHEITAVTDEHVDVPFGLGQLYPYPARDPVAHAGIAVFQVITVGAVRPPQLVQRARQSAGCADDGCVRARGAV